uniref:Uncharacterized protein n=1 Tax=Onchocerca volvulus TaxID=6282 RepID=A0A8R1Y3R5_ONCVO
MVLFLFPHIQGKMKDLSTMVPMDIPKHSYTQKCTLHFAAQFFFIYFLFL